jgi:hypothetical protein
MSAKPRGSGAGVRKEGEPMSVMTIAHPPSPGH